MLAEGEIGDRKALIRALVARITMAPERREIEITLRIPEHMVNVVAGARFEPTT